MARMAVSTAFSLTSRPARSTSPPGRLLRRGVAQVDEVAQDVHAVGVLAGLGHLLGHELARADEHADVAVGADRRVQRGLQAPSRPLASSESSRQRRSGAFQNLLATHASHTVSLSMKWYVGQASL